MFTVPISDKASLLFEDFYIHLSLHEKSLLLTCFAKSLAKAILLNLKKIIEGED